MQILPWKKYSENKVNSDNFLLKVLGNRGIDTIEKLNKIDENTKIYDPMLLNDMDKAVMRIYKAMDKNETILIHGDYDCDGITSTVMLYDYFENEGANVIYYIPDRESEGYGLNMTSAKMIAENSVNLVITVDNGISSHEEIAWLKEKGVDVIVTDHHIPKETLPDCVAVINPHRSDSTYPFDNLCGAGVAFKLITALEQNFEEPFLQYGDLLTIATVADIVSLNGENRYFVKNGLLNLHNTERVGLSALMTLAGIDMENPLTAEQVGFIIAPRLNATGRIGNVDDAVELLLTHDEDEARKKASIINSLNTERKNIESKIIAEIGDYIEKNPQAINRSVTIVVGKDWNAGVIGITASKLVDRYLKPAIILTVMDSGEIRGSARSVEGFSIIDAIKYCGDLLIKYGGHPMAAGLSLKKENLDLFIEKMEEYCRNNFGTMPYKTLAIDGNIDIKDITLNNINSLNTLEPFGCENTQPIPVLRNVLLKAVSPLSNGNHLKLTLGDNTDNTVETLLFSVKEKMFDIDINTPVDVAVSLGINTFRGIDRPSVKVVSIVPKDFDATQKMTERQLFDKIMCKEEVTLENKEKYIFTREKMIVLFKFLRENTPYIAGEDFIYYNLKNQLSYFDVLVSLQILKELKLIKYETVDGVRGIVIVPTKEKTDYKTAETYINLQSRQLA